MREYHKIYTVWKRDPDNRYKTLIPDSWAKPEFEYLKDNRWVATEKIDGTNIRIMFDGEKVIFGGRTDNAQLYAPLVQKLQELFYAGAMSQIFDKPVCLYGEGFGAKIQKGGGNYMPDEVGFCLFDVNINGTWLERGDVVDISQKLQTQIAPLRGVLTLSEAIKTVENGLTSCWGNFEAEGLVLRPEVEMLDRHGHRIITKIKVKDFK